MREKEMNQYAMTTQRPAEVDERRHCSKCQGT